jgi:hypothetical protein
MSPEQQLEKLRSQARLAWLPNGMPPQGLTATALGLLSAGLFTEQAAWFVASAFIGQAGAVGDC